MSGILDKDRDEQSPVAHRQPQVSRRGFLKTGVVATAMGVMGAIAGPPKAAKAVIDLGYRNSYIHEMHYTPIPKGQWSKLKPKVDYGGASVRFVEHNDQWLGTTQIVGKIEKTNEDDGGFPLAVRGLLGKKSQYGFISQALRYPLGDALMLPTQEISKPEIVSGTPKPEKLPIPDPEQMSQHIKDLAYYLRADEVGIGKMPPYGYYKSVMNPPEGAYAAGIVSLDAPYENVPVTESLPYVICVAVEQHLETYMASTGYDGISLEQSFRSYHATANISVVIAQYIRNLGYQARAHHFGNYEAVMGPCLIAAGMGELTRTGDCVAHPRMGFRNKVAAVTTDLPLVPDKPIDFGMLDFCRVCQKCAENCPAEAITLDKDPVEFNGYLRWNTDAKKCAEFRTGNEEGVNCGRCVKTCPWNSKESSWFHDAGIWIGSKGEAASSLLKAIDDMFGYGTEEVTRYKWWLEWPELYKIRVPGQ
ncbi:MAG: reductive dehalogenase [Desulfitobacterium sp.]